MPNIHTCGANDLFLHPSINHLNNILVKMIDEVSKISLMCVRVKTISPNPIHIILSEWQ